MQYPDPSKDRTGFNPIIYPDLDLTYTLQVIPEGKSFRIVVDLDKPLPEDWVGKVGMNIELFPESSSENHTLWMINPASSTVRPTDPVLG